MDARNGLGFSSDRYPIACSSNDIVLRPLSLSNGRDSGCGMCNSGTLGRVRMTVVESVESWRWLDGRLAFCG